MCKVVQLISSLESGGAESLVKDYAIKLKEKGCDVTVVTTDTRKEGSIYKALVDENIKLVCLCGNKINILFSWIRFLRQEKPDVVHGHLKVGLFLFFVQNKRKVFYTFHSNVYAECAAWGRGFLLVTRWLKKRGATLIALSQEMVKDAKKLFGTDGNIICLDNCVNIKKFMEAYPLIDYNREFNIPEGSFVIGHIGRFCEEKNHKKLLQIHSSVLKKKRNAILLLVGDGPMKLDIVRKAEHMGLSQSVRFVGKRSDVAEILKFIDVFVLPSLVEGYPITVIEAQAAGTKSVVSMATPTDAIKTNFVCRLDVHDPDDIWSSAILNETDIDKEYSRIYESDLDTVVNKLLQMYHD